MISSVPAINEKVSAIRQRHKTTLFFTHKPACKNVIVRFFGLSAAFSHDLLTECVGDFIK